MEVRFTDLNEALSWLEETVAGAEVKLKPYVEHANLKETVAVKPQELGRSAMEGHLISLIERVHTIRCRLGDLVGRVVV